MSFEESQLLLSLMHMQQSELDPEIKQALKDVILRGLNKLNGEDKE